MSGQLNELRLTASVCQRRMAEFRLVAMVAALLAAVPMTCGAQALAARPQAPSGPAQLPPRDTPSQPQAAGKAAIRGRVVRADDGAPLGRVHVGLVATGTFIRDLPTALTDADGRFELQGLPAARYTLWASKAGFVTLQYGQRRPHETGRPIELGDGQVLEAVGLALPRGAVITGRVVDESGDAVTGALVQVMRQRYVRGRPQLTGLANLDQTDDRGEFRLHGMPPGTYFLSASVTRLPSPDGVRSIGVGTTTTFYPGTAAPSDAQPVTLALAQELSGLTVSLAPPRTASVSGHVRMPDGQPAATAGVSLAQVALFTSGSGMSSMGGVVRPDGAFSFLDLPPGRYTLNARGQTGSDDLATAHIVLDGSDVVVPLVMGKGNVARGRVRFDTGVPPANLKPPSSLVSMEAADPDAVVTSRPAVVRDDWTFEIPGLTGQRVVRPRPPAGWWVKSIRIGGTDVTDTPLTFDGRDIEGIDILLTNRPTEVSGVVRGSDAQPIGDATVVLFADDPGKWRPDTSFLAVVRPDQSGRFSHRGFPPGPYLAVALDYLEPGEETNPATLERLRALGARVTLAEGQSQTIELKLSELP